MNMGESIHGPSAEAIGRQYGQRAREEMIERLMEGKQVGWVDFNDILDHEIDQGTTTIKEVGELLLTIIAFAKDDYTHVERRNRLEKRIRGMVERWVESHPDQVQLRAEEMYHEEMADAEAGVE